MNMCWLNLPAAAVLLAAQHGSSLQKGVASAISVPAHACQLRACIVAGSAGAEPLQHTNTGAGHALLFRDQPVVLQNFKVMPGQSR